MEPIREKNSCNKKKTNHSSLYIPATLENYGGHENNAYEQSKSSTQRIHSFSWLVSLEAPSDVNGTWKQWWPNARPWQDHSSLGLVFAHQILALVLQYRLSLGLKY